MFSTSSRARARQQQRETSPPPPGSDSCFGVHSLTNSVWSEANGGRLGVHATVDTHDSDHSDERTETQRLDEMDGSAGSDRPEATPTAETPMPLPPDASPVASCPSPEIVPPSPDDALHPLDRARDSHGTFTLSDLDDLVSYRHRLSLAHLDGGMGYGPSEPSSPASFTSLPSYVASVSSLSRTSSPVSGIGFRQSAPHVGVGLGQGLGGEGGGDDDLVLPTLNLPSSSLHVSLKTWNGAVGGIKIALVGGREVVQATLRGLADKVDSVDVGRGTVGVVRDGHVVATIFTCPSVEQVQRLVTEVYVVLDRLLNPQIPTGREEHLKGIIQDFAERNDWVHLVIVLDPDCGSIKHLVDIVPTLSTFHTDATLFALPSTTELRAESRVPTPSPPKLGDEMTPMPSIEMAGSYFAQPVDGALQTDKSDPTTLLVQAIDDHKAVTDASSSKFIAWRVPTEMSVPLDSSVTSHSGASSSFETPAPMPTVARASGGGEWEATLSRRVASAHARRAAHRGRQRRKGEEGTREKEYERERGCGPLFPRSAPRTAAIGLSEIWDGLFGGEGRWIRRPRGWRWGLMAIVVVAVGWGCWSAKG